MRDVWCVWWRRQRAAQKKRKKRKKRELQTYFVRACSWCACTSFFLKTRFTNTSEATHHQALPISGGGFRQQADRATTIKKRNKKNRAASSTYALSERKRRAKSEGVTAAMLLLLQFLLEHARTHARALFARSKQYMRS